MIGIKEIYAYASTIAIGMTTFFPQWHYSPISVSRARIACSNFKNRVACNLPCWLCLLVCFRVFQMLGRKPCLWAAACEFFCHQYALNGVFLLRFLIGANHSYILFAIRPPPSLPLLRLRYFWGPSILLRLTASKILLRTDVRTSL